MASDVAVAEKIEAALEPKPEPPRRVRVSVIGEMLPPVERKDGLTDPTINPTCQREECDGTLRDTGRTQSTASAGSISDLQCTLCSTHYWWRHRAAWELIEQNLSF